MARMIPPYISPEVRSGAEKKLYQLIKECRALEDFTCLHSLGLAKHLSKRQGEVDFVLLNDHTILCLEVKGGRVTRKDGIWFFTDRYGQTNRKTESPFIQASSAMFSLKANLESKFGLATGYVFGYGAVFPDIEFKQESPEWDRGIIYDISDSTKGIEQYIHRLVGYWQKKMGRPENLPRIEKDDVVSYLRGDFETATPLWGEILEKEKEIAYFTNEQYRALDQMEGNSKMVFCGAAGTGKTLLALEKAKRLCFNGQRTLLLCYNRLLGARLLHEAAAINSADKFLHASSVHKYFASVIERAGMKTQLEKESVGKTAQAVYDEVFPSLFIKAFETLPDEKFDFLIIDEGQDLLSENYLLALDCVLSGGFKNGKWAVFLDPGGQAKLFNRFSLEAYEYLKSLGASEYRLDINVRNTLQIARQASVVSGFPSGKTRVEGPKVEYKLCKDDNDMALQVADLLNKLVKEDLVPTESITLLSPRNTGFMSLFASGVKVPRFLLEATEANISALPAGSIAYASAQAFKGLENNIIIYTDLDSFDGVWNETVNYVAMTRAKEKLYVFMNRRLKAEYQDRMKIYANIEQ